MIVSFVNLKGGSAKTTSAVMVACVLADRGGSTLLVDADPQGSAVLWAETATELPFATVGVPSSAVARQVRDLASRYDHVVIDTPPGHPKISSAALAVSDVAVVPVTTGSVDLVRYGATCELIDVATAINEGLRGLALLTKTRTGTASRRDVREALVEVDLLPVAVSEIPLRESIAGAEGTVPDTALYLDLVDEIEALVRPKRRSKKGRGSR